ncbi:MAG: dihydrolipoyl dehydrogenase [Saccharospirillaceae bacterium]|nr:dihydrolipoyl dehydrogenase [Pseudomonadales bacterium]NRB80522.1 dihydrolipoyl dehydrogenase [Saccharospirillaceae bacterium]
MNTIIKTKVLVIGSGPGGYSAAFRLADLGKKVTMVEKHNTLGGVCLNVGCIPSKALLHVSEVINAVKHAPVLGVKTQLSELDIPAIKTYKNNTVAKLVNGVQTMSKSRKVNVIQGEVRFLSANSVQINQSIIEFEHCIIAAGSRSVTLPFIPHEDPRIWNSTDALNVPFVPKRLLVLGGGIIGLEMATVYESLGSEVSIVEYCDQLVPAADKDLVKVYQKYNKKKFNLHLNSKVTAVETQQDAVVVSIEKENQSNITQQYDAVLVAVGRTPNGYLLGAEEIGLVIDEKGFIKVDKKMKTNIDHIFAIGDIVGQPMLAHKATHEAHIAAEVICGHDVIFDAKCIASIAYTDPEIAWVGLTEKEAKANNLDYQIATFPWSASGRALASNRSEGKTKLIYAKDSGVLLGAGIVGKNAGELLAELSLAIEFAANIEDIALTIHAHPTLSESVGLAAEIAMGTITDLPNSKAKLNSHL